MSDFKSALSNFLTGQLDFAGLEAALNTEFQANPAAVPEMVAGMLLIAVLIGLLLPDYLHKRRIANILEVLKSGDTSAINEALLAFDTLQSDDRDWINQEAKGELITWYQKEIDLVIDEMQGRYDYPAAERNAKAALDLYPNSVSIQSLQERIESRKNQLLKVLDTRYNQYLVAGCLLPSEEDGIDDVLKILTQVQPDHPLLSDPRLSTAYREQATQLFEASELEQQLNSVSTSLSSLEGVNSLREPVWELRNLKADASVLTNINRAVGKLLDAPIQKLIARRDWEAARTLLGEYADLLESAWVQEGKQHIDNAEQAYRHKIDNLYAVLLDAIAK